MQRIANQLNKVKAPASKKDVVLPVRSTVAFIGAIIEDAGTLNDKKVILFNCATGMVAIGVGLCEPGYFVMALGTNPDPILTSNLSAFQLSCDLVMVKKDDDIMFAKNSHDIAIVGPSPTKTTGIDLQMLTAAARIAATSYALYKTEFRAEILKTFKAAMVIATIEVVLPGSAHYSKKDNGVVLFDIIKLECNSTK